jgi:3',5'-nucleoside bisphosphate phosphatase
MFRADLHCHTTASDGTYSPLEIIALAQREGLQGLSITDHDTIEAYREALPAAKEANILLGTGVEFSCHLLGTSIHVLGYDYPPNSASIHDFSRLHRKRRTHRNRAILKKLSLLRMPLDEEELAQMGTMIGRPHIAQLMIKKGYVKTLKEAFDLYLGDGERCYDAGEPFSIPETIDLIHQVGGKAFLAHPHLIEKRKTIDQLLTLNFDGIECYYAHCPPGQEKRWLKIAREKKWLISGGSDFHGAIKPHIPLGRSWVDEASFRAIFSHSF